MTIAPIEFSGSVCLYQYGLILNPGDSLGQLYHLSPVRDGVEPPMAQHIIECRTCADRR